MHHQARRLKRANASRGRRGDVLPPRGHVTCDGKLTSQKLTHDSFLAVRHRRQCWRRRWLGSLHAVLRVLVSFCRRLLFCCSFFQLFFLVPWYGRNWYRPVPVYRCRYLVGINLGILPLNRRCRCRSRSRVGPPGSCVFSPRPPRPSPTEALTVCRRGRPRISPPRGPRPQTRAPYT